MPLHSEFFLSVIAFDGIDDRMRLELCCLAAQHGNVVLTSSHGIDQGSLHRGLLLTMRILAVFCNSFYCQ